MAGAARFLKTLSVVLVLTGAWSDFGMAQTSSDGDLQIVSGTAAGRLQIWDGKADTAVWKGICNDDWNRIRWDNAGVACRQLGYRAGSAIERFTVSGDNNFLLDDVRCTGHEGNLLACGNAGRNIHNCKDNEHVGVTCNNDAPLRPQTLTAEPGDGRVALSWAAPSDAGTTLIVRYEFRVKLDDGINNELWTEIPNSAPGQTNALSYTVATYKVSSNDNVPIVNDTLYAFRVRAVNGSDTGAPSREATATPADEGNSAPIFDDGDSTTRSVAENTAADTAVGAPMLAKDGDNDSLTYTLGGTDGTSFRVHGSGQLRTYAALDHEAKSTYVVTVTVSDGTDTDTITVTINVTDVAEPPPAPAAPTVAGATVNSLTASWTAPATAGRPAIDDYDVRWRVKTPSGSWIELVGGADSTATAATITGLDAATTYEVQVRATNAEGDSPWSASRDGTTSAPPPPSAPAITSVAFANAPRSGQADYFKLGDDVDVVVTWDVAVTVENGTPSVQLLVGSLTSAATDAAYVSGSGTQTLTFRYRVAAGHQDDDGLSVPAGSVALNGGTIVKQGATVGAGLAHNAVAPDSARKVDGVAPTANRIGIPNNPYRNTHAPNGQTADINWIVVFSEAVVVVGTPYVEFTLGAATKQARYTGLVNSIDGILPLQPEFVYTVVDGDFDGDGVGHAADPVRLNGGSIRDKAGNDAVFDIRPNPLLEGHKVDAVKPVLQTAAVTGTTLTLTYDEALDNTGPSPSASAFTVALATGTAPMVSTVAVSGRAVTLTLSQAVRLADVVTLSYTAPTGMDATPIRDAFGNVAGDLVNQEVAQAVANVAQRGDLKIVGGGTSGRLQIHDGADWKGICNDEWDKTNQDNAGVACRQLGYRAGSAIESFTVLDMNFLLDDVRCTGHEDNLLDCQHAGSGVHNCGILEHVGVTCSDLAPSAPENLTAVAGNGEVALSWAAPSIAGRTPIVRHEFVVKVGNDGYYQLRWTEIPNSAPSETNALSYTVASYTAGFDSAPIANGTSYAFLVRAVNGSTPGTGGPSNEATARPVGVNNAPTFGEGDTATRSVAENTPAGQPVGDAVAATDTDGDTLTYTLGGTDMGSFDIVSTSGQLQTKLGVTYDYETTQSYAVTVTVSDGTATDTIAMTINVTDVAAPPAPAAPTVTGATESSLTVSWMAPAITGRPEITDYDVRYRVKASEGSWIDGPQNVVATSATITGLTASETYEVQVRATNAEGDSDWSASRDGATSAPPPPSAPAITSVVIANNPASSQAGYFKSGDEVYVALNWDAAVTVDRTAGTPSVRLRVGSLASAATDAAYVSGSGTAVLTFRYRVAAGHQDDDGLSVPAGSVALNGGTIVKRGAAVDAGLAHTGVATDVTRKVDGVAPIVFGIDIPSEPPAYTHVPGSPTADINWVVIFPEAVVVRSGRPYRPYVEFILGTDTRRAFYSGDVRILTQDAPVPQFVYTVVDGDFDGDGVGHAANPVRLNGGSIRDKAGNDAVLNIAPSVLSDHKVDGVKPVLQTAAVTGTTLILTYDEALDNTGSSSLASAFTVALATGTAPTVSTVAVSGQAVTLTLSQAVLSEDMVTLSYTAPTGTDATPIRDIVGNAADNFTSEAVTNATTNAAPTFPSATATRAVAENTPAGDHVGDAVTATDDDADAGDTLTYDLEGSDEASFDIDASTGQIKTKTELDFETKESYTVTVTATDRAGATATITVTIDVTDEDEAPDAPAAPTVTAGSDTASLVVTWQEPANAGPEIIDYDVRYQTQQSPQGSSWTGLPGMADSTDTTATITGLDAATTYEVQVRARNDEGDSDWSASGDGTTTPNSPATGTVTIGDTAPHFGVALTVTVSDVVDENGVPDPLIYSYQWVRVDDASEEQDIDSATRTSYTPVVADVGKKLKVRVQFTDDGSNTETLTSGETAAVTQTVTVSVTASPNPVAEDDSLTVTVTAVTQIAAPPTGPVPYTILTEDGTATRSVSEQDFGPLQTHAAFQAAIFAANPGGTAYVAEQTFPLSIEDDTLAEGPETFDVKVEKQAGAPIWMQLGSPVTVTITDNDRVPGEPTNLVATGGNAKVTLTWLAPSDEGSSSVTSYDYRVSDDGGNIWAIWTDAGNAVTTEITGLTNDTEYTFEVRAVNEVGPGGPSNTARATPGAEAPGAPTELRAKAGHERATLTWIAASDGGSAILRHEYRQKQGAGSYGGWVEIPDSAPDGANATGYTVTGLTNGKNYTFEVRAVNGTSPGEGAVSDPATPGPGTPDAPTDLEAMGGDKSAVLIWAVPDFDGGSAILHYEYRWSQDGEPFEDWVRIPDSASGEANERSYTVMGLTNGVAYTFEVRAGNSNGEGDSSNPIQTTPVAAPDAPTGLQAAGSDASVTLTWAAPVSDGGSPILRYEYRQRAGTLALSGGWVVIGDSAGATELTLTGLTNGVEYAFQVRAVNAVGEGDPSDQARATPSAVPSAPVLLSAKSGNQRAILTWRTEDGGQRVLRHEYRIRQAEAEEYVGDWASIPDSAPGGTNAISWTVIGLTNGEEYIFQVRAVTAAGPSRPSNEHRVTPAPEAPSAPTGLEAEVSKRQATLTWTAAPDGGSAILHHEYRQRKDDAAFADDWLRIPASAPGETHATGFAVTGLDYDSAYGFQVRAVNAVGGSDPSNETRVTVAATVPDAPTDLVAQGVNRDVNLTWIAPVEDGGRAIDRYDYRYKQDGETFGDEDWTPIPDSASRETNERSYTVMGLTNGVAYTFEVRAANEIGASSPSGEARATPIGEPGAPTGLRAEGGDEQATLSWTVPADIGGSPIQRYEYRWETVDESSDWLEIPDSAPDGAHATGYTVTGLTNGTTYTFRVRAVIDAAAGESQESGDATVTPAKAPDAPTELSAEAGHEQATLTWTAPADDGGSAILRHEYRQKQGSGSYGVWIEIPDSAPGEAHATGYTVTGLTNDEAYTFQVRAVNGASAGEGDASNEARAMPKPGVPSAPTELSAEPGHERATLSWTVPAFDGGSAIVGYAYRQKQGAGDYGDWVEIPDSAPGEAHATGYTVTGLTNDEVYTFQVRAVNGASPGEGDASNEAPATPEPGAPGAPTELSAEPGNERATLSWTAPAFDGGSAILRHEYRQKDGAGSYGDWVEIPNSAPGEAHATGYTVTGLTNDEMYTFQVRAVNGASPGEGDASNEAPATPEPGAPGAPTELSAEPGHERATLSWTAPASNGGSAILRHEYRQQQGAGDYGGWVVIPDSAPGEAHATGYTVTGLTNDEAYTFQVRAVNGASPGEGAESNEAETTPVRDVPSAPTDLTAEGGDKSAVLRWAAPASNGGSDILGYAYRQQQDDGSYGAWVEIPDSAPEGANEFSWTVSGLASGAEYVFEVRARNANGPGDAAGPVRVDLAPTKPSAPTALTAADGLKARVQLNWTAPEDDGGSPIQSHEYRRKANSGNYGRWITIPDSGADDAHAIAFLVDRLTNGTEYTFEVRARNAVEASDASNAARATPRDVPDAPTGLDAVPGDKQAMLTWTVPADGGGSPILSHEFRKRQEGEAFADEWHVIGDSGAGGTNQDRHTVRDLVNGTEYIFQVRARNTAGPGDTSNEAQVMPLTVPDAPASLTAEARNLKVVLTWAAPADDGGSPVQSYEYRLRQDGADFEDDDWDDWQAIFASSEETVLTVTGLSNGVAYAFQVRAINVAGYSEASGEAVATPAASAPNPPIDLFATVDRKNVALAWTAPADDGGSPILSYEYRQRVDTAAFENTWIAIVESAPGEVNTVDFVVTGLTYGSDYVFQVRAVNTVAASDPSNEADAAVVAVAPVAPTELAAEAGDERAVLTWAAPVDDGDTRIVAYEYRQRVGDAAFQDNWIPIPDSGEGEDNESSFTVTGLTNGSTYSFQVRALNDAAGAGPPSGEDAATPVAVPAAPTGFDAVPGNASIVLSWTAPADDGGSPILSYEYRQRVGDAAFQDNWIPIPDSGEGEANESSYTVTGLTNGSTYSFQVRALNDAAGAGPPSGEDAATPVAVPAAPTGFDASRGNTEIELRWTAPADVGSSPIVRYQYRQRAGDAAFQDDWISIPDSGVGGANESSYTVTGLTNGITYGFQVRAVNSQGHGVGEISDEVSVTPAIAPGAPSALTAQGVNTAVVLSWTAPADNGGDPITHYDYRQREGGAAFQGDWTSIPDSGVGEDNELAFTVTGLTNGTTYSFQVRAVNEVGPGVASNTAAATPADVPGAPTDLEAARGDGQIALTWIAPTDGGASPILRYEFRQRQDGTAFEDNWQAIPDSGVGEDNALAFTVTGLTNGTTYSFQVRAVNEVGPGVASNTAAATPADVPGAPTGLAAAPAHEQVTLSWTAADDGGSPILRYEGRQRVGDTAFEDNWQAIPDSGEGEDNALSFTVTGLTNGTTYGFEVRAVNELGSGVASNTAAATPADVPGAPTGLAAAPAHEQVTLSWTAADDGGRPILRYEYRQRAGDTAFEDNWQAIPDSGVGGTNALSFTVTGLTNGTTYSFQVRAVNEMGSGVASNTAAATPADVPAAPTGLEAAPAHARVALTWTASADDGGSRIVAYDYRQREGDAAFQDDWTSIPDSGAGEANEQSYTVTGLTNDVTYGFQVRAVNAASKSAPSNEAQATPALTKPDAPTGLEARSFSLRAVLAWTAPADDGGSPILRYEYRQRAGDTAFEDNWQAIPDSGVGGTNALSFTVTGLTNGVMYGFEVRAVNTVAASDPSNEAMAVPGLSAVVRVTGASGTYIEGDQVDITIAFNEAMRVETEHGSPGLVLELDAADRVAVYLEGSGTMALVFRYTVEAGDASSDLQYRDVNALVLNAGAIVTDQGSTPANLQLPALDDSASLAGGADIVVDTSRSRIFSIAGGGVLEGEDVEFTVSLARAGQPRTMTVDYGTVVLPADTAQAGVDYTATSGTLSFGPGETEKTFAVETIRDEGSVEPKFKTFTARLSRPSAGAAVSPTGASAQGRILDLTAQPDGSETIEAGDLTLEMGPDGQITAIRDNIANADHALAAPEHRTSLISLIVEPSADSPTRAVGDAAHYRPTFWSQAAATPATGETARRIYTFQFAGGIEVAVEAVGKSEGYATLEVKSIDNPNNLDIRNVLWGPLLTDIVASVGDQVGVVSTRDFALGMFGTNVKTTGGWPQEYADIGYRANVAGGALHELNWVQRG